MCVCVYVLMHLCLCVLMCRCTYVLMYVTMHVLMCEYVNLSMSISDWKNEYAEFCDECILKSECGGLFATSRRQSEGLKPIINECLCE